MRCRRTCSPVFLTYLVALVVFGFPVLSSPVSASKPVESIQNPPGLLFNSLLDNITINANGGWIKIGNNLVGVFMPEDASGKLVLTDYKGNEIAIWPWEALRERYSPPFHLIRFRNAMNKNGEQAGADELRLNEAGDYKFDFFLAGKKIYSFPIRIKELKPPDPFGGESKFVAEGAWTEWGYIHFAENAGSPFVSWKLWLREWQFEPKPRSIEVELRDPSGKLIAENRVRSSVTFRHDWKRLDFELHKPKDNSLFRADELLAKDGVYELTMKMEGGRYGIWKLEVKGGKLVTKGRAERGKADPLTFVEGGSNAFWFRNTVE